MVMCALRAALRTAVRAASGEPVTSTSLLSVACNRTISSLAESDMPSSDTLAVERLARRASSSFWVTDSPSRARACFASSVSIRYAEPLRAGERADRAVGTLNPTGGWACAYDCAKNELSANPPSSPFSVALRHLVAVDLHRRGRHVGGAEGDDRRRPSPRPR